MNSPEIREFEKSCTHCGHLNTLVFILTSEAEYVKCSSCGKDLGTLRDLANAATDQNTEAESASR